MTVLAEEYSYFASGRLMLIDEPLDGEETAGDIKCTWCRQRWPRYEYSDAAYHVRHECPGYPKAT